jgi:hypothetical protein
MKAAGFHQIQKSIQKFDLHMRGLSSVT